jgi:Ankyrin repeats (many copies)
VASWNVFPAKEAGRRPPLLSENETGNEAGNETGGCWTATQAKDSKGNTPLHYAAGYGRVPLVQRLIEAGAIGSAQNSSGHTPIQLVRWAPLPSARNDVNSCQAPPPPPRQAETLLCPAFRPKACRLICHRMEPKNPVNDDGNTYKLLEDAEAA